MCGIVGYIGYREAISVLLDGLKRLEYRGYDSAGIAVSHHGEILLEKSRGKLNCLIDKVHSRVITGNLGIGHTRWATHGPPNEANAHPHQSNKVALVHNGIIENFHFLKERVIKLGYSFSSETDTEVVAHLVDYHLSEQNNDFLKAFVAALDELEGSFSLALIFNQDSKNIYVAKKGSPLIIGRGQHENFIASDLTACLPYTQEMVVLEDDEIAVVSESNVLYYDNHLNEITKTSQKINWTPEMAEKGGFKHFMMKEIFEQPQVITDTYLGRAIKGEDKIILDEIESFFKAEDFPSFDKLYIIACGTSLHAAMAGKYYIEAMAKISVNVDMASEFRYREPFIDDKTLLISISQSGETADTLACVKDAKESGARVISICNVVGSSIPRESDATIYTHAGPEIGVASTKAFTTQMVVLLLLAVYFGQKNQKLNIGYVKRAIDEIHKIPEAVQKIIDQKDDFLRIARKYYQKKDFYYIARGVHYPISLEGALKLKEISYIHAEGYSAGEMKHGPIALIEPGTPVIALAPNDRVCQKMIANIEEVKARGASVIVVTTKGHDVFDNICDEIIYVDDMAWYAIPVLMSIPLQLLAYYISDLKGTDIDQPRNLAKSVTVE
jgi:glucosamine--fructose-6-phosphate aminotransferase (isomerizing)